VAAVSHGDIGFELHPSRPTNRPETRGDQPSSAAYGRRPAPRSLAGGAAKANVFTRSPWLLFGRSCPCAACPIFPVEIMLLPKCFRSTRQGVLLVSHCDVALVFILVHTPTANPKAKIRARSASRVVHRRRRRKHATIFVVRGFLASRFCFSIRSDGMIDPLIPGRMLEHCDQRAEPGFSTAETQDGLLRDFPAMVNALEAGDFGLPPKTTRSASTAKRSLRSCWWSFLAAPTATPLFTPIVYTVSLCPRALSRDESCVAMQLPRRLRRLKTKHWLDDARRLARARPELPARLCVSIRE